MNPTLYNSKELEGFFAESEAEWMLLVSADGRPYIMTYGGEGDPFTQTIPEGDEDGHLIDRGSSLLDNHPGSWYPVEVVRVG